MSILYSLRRWIDPVRFQIEAAERKRAREVLPPDVDPDDLDVEVPPAVENALTYICRVCAHTSSDPSYCPSCLADTMTAAPKPAPTG